MCPLPSSSSFAHTHMCLLIFHLLRSWFTVQETHLRVGFSHGEQSSWPCLPYCVQPSMLHTEQASLSSEFQGKSGSGQRQALRAEQQACPGSAWLYSELGRGGTEPCQELFLKAPVLRPSRPGSVTVTCVGAGHGLLYQKLWQLLQLWGWLPSLPTHTGLQRGLISCLPLTKQLPFSNEHCIVCLLTVASSKFWRN